TVWPKGRKGCGRLHRLPHAGSGGHPGVDSSSEGRTQSPRPHTRREGRTQRRGEPGKQSRPPWFPADPEWKRPARAAPGGAGGLRLEGPGGSAATQPGPCDHGRVVGRELAVLLERHALRGPHLRGTAGEDPVDSTGLRPGLTEVIERVVRLVAPF